MSSKREGGRGSHIGANVMCARCRKAVLRHDNAIEERIAGGGMRLFHRRRCWPREQRERKRALRLARKQQRAAAALANGNGSPVAPSPLDPPIHHHFIPPELLIAAPPDAMFDFTSPPIPYLPEPEPPVELVAASDDLPGYEPKRRDGRTNPVPHKRAIAWKALHALGDQPFTLDNLVAADPRLSREEYQTQINELGRFTGRIACRRGGPGYPFVYRLLEEPRALKERESFIYDDDLVPHASALGIESSVARNAPEKPKEEPMAETPKVSPLKARVEARKAEPETPPPLDREKVIAALDQFEELLVVGLDDLRKSLGLDE